MVISLQEDGWVYGLEIGIAWGLGFGNYLLVLELATLHQYQGKH